MASTLHFRQRVKERVGPSIDGYKLARELILGIENRDTEFVSFVGRASRCGRRVFRFRIPNRGTHYALIDTTSTTCITVLAPGFSVSMEGKGKIILEDKDL